VLHALANAAARGVQVRVLLTPRARAGARDLDALHTWLTNHGVEVRRFASGMKYHAKYLVADERLALVTTLNLTARCFERTCDFTLITRDPAIVSGLIELFAADTEGRAVRLTAEQRERLIVGPDQQPRERFASLVRAARRSVRILDAKLADPHLVALLEERARRGITVDRARRRDVRPLRRHGKLLIVDSDTAVIGSLAMSTRGFEQRRELAIVTRNPALVTELDAFWHAHVSHARGIAATVDTHAEMTS
jgi:phosphatidylserine/phosphatidylglycerophosphate/cardiolipin synthase-like enzyme